MLPTDDGRFYEYSWVSKITCLLVAAGLSMKKISPVFESKDIVDCIHCWTLIEGLITATFSYTIIESMNARQRSVPVEEAHEVD